MSNSEALGTAVVDAPAISTALPRRKRVFAVAGTALLMASIDQTVVSTALTSIQHDLVAGVEWAGWTITIYALGQMLAMPIVGKLSDLYGRKRVFMIAIVVFTAASLLCGLANNIYVLIAFRALQSLGGGAFMPSVSGIVADHFGSNRDRALGMLTSIFPIGAVIGPVLGGVILAYGSWRDIFFVNVPIGIALVIVGAMLFPKGVTHPGHRLDFVGVGLLAVLVLSSMFGVTNLGSGASVTSPLFWVPVLVAVVTACAFAWHSRHAQHPFIPLRLLIGRQFGAMNVINLLLGAAAVGFASLVPLYAQDRYGVTPLAAGILLTARAVGIIAFTSITVVLMRRIGHRLPMVVGLCVTAIGLVMLYLPSPGIPVELWLAIGGAVTGVGMGTAIPPANNATLQLATGEIATISGLRGMMRQCGAILAVSIMTAAVARAADAGLALGIGFLVLAGCVVAATALVAAVPEHRGSW